MNEQPINSQPTSEPPMPSAPSTLAPPATPVSPSSLEDPDAKKNVKMFALGFGGLLLALIVIIIGVGAYRTYAKAATDPFTVAVARVLRLPAFKVNGVTALYSDYADDLNAIHVMKQYDAANSGPGANLTDQQMSDQVALRIINNILLAQAATDNGVTVTDQDVATLRDQVMKQFKSQADVDAELRKRYGWNLATYEVKVMRPYVLQTKLTEKIQADPTTRAALRGKAQSVLDQIKKGADFAQMAKQFGSDGTASQGGDLGWFGKGDMVPQFEAVAFSLKKGELDSNVVETPYGYHIIRVDDKRMQTPKDAKGKATTQPQIRARHILFAFPTVSTYLSDLLKKSVIHLYIPIHNPLQALNVTA